MDPFHQQDGGGLGAVVAQPRRKDRRQRRRIPRCHVVLWDSDDHSYEYVESMLRQLFGHSPEQCHQLAETVDAKGRATVLTTTREHAELKRDQILAFGKDQIVGCKGSMWATVEDDA